MIDGKDLPDAIQWHEGMLLAPQHFQQADLRSEGLVHYHMGIAAPFHWGVRTLTYDDRALASGVFQITQIEALLPDGVLVNTPLQVDLNSFVENQGGRGELTIHLAVPARRGPTEPVAGSVPRYASVEGYPVADEHLGEGAVRIPRLQPAAQLLVTETPAEKYTSFPIAKIILERGNFEATDFAPPVLAADAVGYPGTAVSELARAVREKSRFLSDKVRASSAMVRGDKIRDLQGMVEKLFVGLPPLEALLAVRGTHPFHIYQALTALAGHMAGLTPGLLPTGFKRYDHNNLRDSFDEVLGFCYRMVNSVEQAYEVIAFQFDRDAFRLRLRSAWSGTSAVIGAVGAPGATESSVLSWVMEARVGTADRIKSIEDRRIRGAKRTRIDSDDDLGLVPSSGVLLFRIELDPEFVTDEEVLTLSHPAERQGRERPAEIVFYAPDQVNV
ncbi:MAG: type VI secretion system baseplate subunit TssK [Proteobacteria bacterium]|nr:type VI secretion system baseplate subunit TssK [Pseudomonadota bacterium]